MYLLWMHTKRGGDELQSLCVEVIQEEFSFFQLHLHCTESEEETRKKREQKGTEGKQGTDLFECSTEINSLCVCLLSTFAPGSGRIPLGS